MLKFSLRSFYHSLKKILYFLYEKISYVLRFLWHAYEKFNHDEGFSKTSAIAYTTIVSLIPTLTVGLTFYSLAMGLGSKKDEIFRKILIFLQEHNININVDPLFEVLSSLVENAAKIGGIGLVVLIFSATATLRTVDQALNRIWRVRKERPLLLQIVYYWAALTLGPLMLISGTTLAAKVSSFFSPPAYTGLAQTSDQKILLIGSAHTIGYWQDKQLVPNQITLESIKDKNFFQLEPQNPYLSPDKNSILNEKILKKINFLSISIEKSQYWLVSDNGYLFHSEDKGKEWSAFRFGNLEFKQFLKINDTLILCAKNGYLLYSFNNGQNWNIKRWAKISADFNTLAFDGSYLWLAGSDGLLLRTSLDFDDHTIFPLPQLKKQNRRLGITSLEITPEKEVYLAGEEGIILRGQLQIPPHQWNNLSFSKSNFFKIKKISDKNLLVVGEEGKIIYSYNDGLSWQEKKLNQEDLTTIALLQNKVYILGNMQTVIETDPAFKKWEIHQSKSFIIMLVNFFAPFVLIWLLFLILYRVLPNTKVPLKSASIGAAFTGTVWVFFVLLFILYVRSFSYGTFAIYGALTALPISLLMIYCSTLIFILGAEVAFLHAHPHYLSHRYSKLGTKPSFPLLKTLTLLYQHFQKGLGALPFKKLQEKLGIPAHHLEIILNEFQRKNLIIETEHGYFPEKPANQISLWELHNIFPDIFQEKLYGAEKNHEITWLNNLQKEWNQTLESNLMEKTLADLL